MKYKCLNPISKTGLDYFDDQYEEIEEASEADVLLVRVHLCMIWKLVKMFKQ